MALSSRDDRELELIAAHLHREDPRFARRLTRFATHTGPQHLPAPSPRALMVIILGWAAVGFLPLFLGLAWANPWLAIAGAVICIATPAVGPTLTCRAYRGWRGRGAGAYRAIQVSRNGHSDQHASVERPAVDNEPAEGNTPSGGTGIGGATSPPRPSPPPPGLDSGAAP